MVVRVCCVRGSHYRVGHQIGRAFRAQIAEYFRRYPGFVKLLATLQTDGGRNAYEGYLKAAKSAFPHYVDEIVGMSEGSGLPFEHLFLMHCQSEFTLMSLQQEEVETETEGCTTVYLNVRNGPRLLAHNEDGDSLIKALGYVVVASIEPYELPSGEVVPEESFTAFCYPGLLAGNAYGFNLHGLCTAGNFQLAKCVEKDKIPQRFACRALLSAASVEQAVDILRTGCGVGMASGYSYNLAVSTKDGDNAMYSVEVAPAEGEARNLVSVHAVEPGEVGSASSFNHYNMYEHMDTPSWRDFSSEHRKARAGVVGPLSTKEDVLKFMGDTEDPEYPVYRSLAGNDVFMTTTTGVFDLEAGVLEIYTDNPAKGQEPGVIFVLPSYSHPNKMAPRVLHVSGTNRQVGLQVGKATKKQIQDVLSRYEPFKEAISSLETPEGRRVYEGYLKAAKTAYPNYVAELEGMAEGADVPFEHMFIVNYEFEILLLNMKKKEEEKEGLKACTTVFLNYRDGPRVLAHNEDGPAGEQGCLLVAHVEPYSLPGGRTLPEENFVSYCYTCLLPGVAYSFNSHGLCVTCNTLVSKEAEENKIGLSFACRAVLSASTVDEAVSMLRDDGVGMAIGYSFNMVSTRDSARTMCSVETSAALGQPTTLVSVHTVEPVGGSAEGHYYHYNLYEHLSVPEWPLSPSSHHRKARAAEMAAPRTKQDVLTVLGDTKDPEYPIFRSGTGKDKGYTLSTAVFDLQEGVLEVYIGNPTVHTEPALQFYLPG